MENKSKNNNFKYLHGNSARINPEKNIVPRFTNYVVNDNLRHGREVFNRLDDDAEFCKKEVDNNKK